MEYKIEEYSSVIDGVVAARRAVEIASIVMDVVRFADMRSPVVRRSAIIVLLARRGESVRDMAVPAIDDAQEAVLSNARVRAMELGLSPWPSASGWAPMDLPWKERRILIGIVEGIASLSTWAHMIWHRDNPWAHCNVHGCYSPDPPECEMCGTSDCPA